GSGCAVSSRPSWATPPSSSGSPRRTSPRPRTSAPRSTCSARTRCGRPGRPRRCSPPRPTPTAIGSASPGSWRSDRPVTAPEWTRLTIHETVAALRAGAVSAPALVDAYLARIAALDGTLGAFLTVAGDAARAQAEAADQRFRRGEPPRALEGVPLALKDVLCTRGVRTTCGSRILADFVPPYDANAVARLLAAGAIVLG